MQALLSKHRFPLSCADGHYYLGMASIGGVEDDGEIKTHVNYTVFMLSTLLVYCGLASYARSGGNTRDMCTLAVFFSGDVECVLATPRDML